MQQNLSLPRSDLLIVEMCVIASGQVESRSESLAWRAGEDETNRNILYHRNILYR